MCHGFGAASFVSCDRCGGLGKRLHDIHLSTADDAPTSDLCQHHCHGKGNAAAEDADSLHGCGGNNGGGNCSGPNAQRNGTGGGGCVGGGIGGLGQADCGDGKDNAAPESASAKGDANDGGLKLSQNSDCAKCKGTGKIPAPWNEEGGGYCTRCAGAGFVEAEAELVLSIPAGVEKGQTEVYKDKGHVDIAGGWQVPLGLSTSYFPFPTYAKRNETIAVRIPNVWRAGLGLGSCGLCFSLLFTTAGEGSVWADQFQAHAR